MLGISLPSTPNLEVKMFYVIRNKSRLQCSRPRRVLKTLITSYNIVQMDS